MNTAAAFLDIDHQGDDEAGATAAQPTASTGIGAFIWPQTVIDEKNRLSGYIEPLRFVVRDCAGLTKEQKAAWADFYVSWRKFYCRNESGQCDAPDYSIWGLGSQMDEAQDFERQANAWYDELAGAKCALTEPKQQGAPAPPDWSSIVRWGAIGTIALVAAYAVSKAPFAKGRR